MPLNDKLVSVLFLCTGNSARSIMGEALLRHYGGDRFRTLSAGSKPAGRVHPLALEALAARGVATQGLASKAVEDIGGAPADIVITVCDAAAESCPVLPGAPLLVHWGLPDPAAETDNPVKQRAAFDAVCRTLEARIQNLVALPLAEMAPTTVQQSLQELVQS